MGRHREQEERIKRVVAPAVAAADCELLGVEVLPRGGALLLRVYIDTPDGVTVDDCERASRQVSAALDVEDPIPGAYTLEVSSPGIERPLFEPEHFARFAGEPVHVRLEAPLEGRRNLKGLLRGFSDGAVLVEEDGRQWRVPYESVARAHLRAR
jgi:ribosome maturation factor RimP